MIVRAEGPEATIGLLIGERADRDLLEAFFGELGYRVTGGPVNTLDPAQLDTASLLIVDEQAAQSFADPLLALKRAMEPVVLPILVLVPERARIGDWIRRGFDDVLRAPLGKDELLARVEAHLRLRAISVRAARDSAEKFRQTFDLAPSGIAHTAMDSTILLVNARLCDMFGYTEQELCRLKLVDLVFSAELDSTLGFRRRLVEGSSQREVVEKSYLRKDGTVLWAEQVMTLVRDTAGQPSYFISIINDITDRKKLETDMRAAIRARAFAAHSNRVLVHAMGEQQLFDDMCKAAVESGGYRMAWIGIPQQDEGRTIRVAAGAGVGLDYLDAMRVTWRDGDERAQSAAGTAVRTGVTTIIADTARDPRMAPWRLALMANGFRSIIGLPLVSTGRVLGVLVLHAGEPDAFSREEVALLEELAADTAYGVAALRNRDARLAAERALEESARFAIATIDALSNHVCVLDESGTILAVNRAWRAFAESNGGLQSDSMFEGGNYLEVCDRAAGAHADEAPIVAEALRGIIAGTRDEFSIEYPCHGPENERWFLMTVSRFAGEGPTRVVVTHEDITANKQADRELRESEERFRSLTELSSDWYWEQDENYRFIRLPGGTERVNPSDHIGKTRWEIGYANMTEADWAGHRAMLDARQPFRDLVFSRTRADGGTYFVSISGEPIFDERGNFKGYRGVGRDITLQKEAEAALRDNEERLRSTLDAALDCVISIDVAGRIIDFNPAAEKTFGYSRAEALGQDMASLMIPERYREAHFRGMTRHLENPDFHALNRRREVQALRRDGSEFPAEIAVVSTRTHDQTVFTAFLRDVSERKAAETRLLHMAHYDSLTDLPNRVLIQDRLRQAVAQALRSNRPGALLFIDLDRFKWVNDTLGHPVGDRLLKEVSARLEQCLRSGDTVGRLGGDEFAVILSNLSKAQDAQIVAQNIMCAFDRPFESKGHETFVTVSVGITVFPNDGQDADTLIRNADAAMYRAKDDGRNTFALFTSDMNARATDRLKLESDLRRALERREFRLHYQPRVDATSGRIVGVEALLRWQRSDGTMVSPGEFVPLLEETGLILPVGDWVMEEACRQHRAWTEACRQPLPVAVNLSPRQLHNHALTTRVRSLIETYAIAPDMLELEITESSLMRNSDEAVRMLTEIRELGVRIAIDDFGTGYSSLSYLKRFPVDYLKIDQSFVRDVTADADDAAIARTIIIMAHQLGLKVIAEGVETAEQLAFLQAYDCDEAQGYLFSRPVPADAIATLLQDARSGKVARAA
ncbi:MAG: EAL domain-containing protein [Burkholderiales bacterium]